MAEDDLMIDAAATRELDAEIARIVAESGASAAQYALAADGRVLHTRALGRATTQSRFCIFSASKPIFASLVLHLAGTGRLDLEAPVVAYWPEFGHGGRDRITVEQLLLFTAGIPSPWPAPPTVLDPERRAREIISWPLETEPGTTYAYHSVSAHWVLAELVRRTTGLDHRQALHELILAPLGLDRLRLGVPAEDQADIVPAELIGEYDLPLSAAMLGLDATAEALDRAAGLALEIGSSPALIEAGVPGGGIISDAASVALFYQALLHGDERLWRSDLLQRATSETRNDLPDAGRGGAPANRTIGSLTVAGADSPEFALPALGITLPVRHHGGLTSACTFGHPGFGGQLAFADPEHGYSFALLINGSERDARRGAMRDRAVADAVARAVGP
ncbi:serine hydrolase domain-containing protein [Microbacterium sp. NPDC090218]